MAHMVPTLPKKNFEEVPQSSIPSLQHSKGVLLFHDFGASAGAEDFWGAGERVGSTSMSLWLPTAYLWEAGSEGMEAKMSTTKSLGSMVGPPPCNSGIIGI